MRSLLLATTVAAIAAAAAPAQETLRLDVTRASTPADPVVDIVIWVAFDMADYAYLRAYFDLEAGSGRFSSTDCFPQPGITCQYPPPKHVGSSVLDIRAAQLHAPALGYFADRSNPIKVIKTSWRPDAASTGDVEVVTRTSVFDVYIDDTGAWESRLSTFAEGSAIIRVRQCYADCDGTEDLDLFDFLCFQDAFATGDFYADCDASGVLDIFDFLCFQNEFVAGCL